MKNMTTADKMLEDLGYEKLNMYDEDDEETITYIMYVFKYSNIYKAIGFDLIDKTLEITSKQDGVLLSGYLEQGEVKAISLKLLELEMIHSNEWGKD